eukprot:2717290-Lingulodinium_polyedra.AAC.1
MVAPSPPMREPASGSSTLPAPPSRPGVACPGPSSPGTGGGVAPPSSSAPAPPTATQGVVALARGRVLAAGAVSLPAEWREGGMPSFWRPVLA